MIYFCDEPIYSNGITYSRTVIQFGAQYRNVTLTEMRKRYNDGKPENEQCSAQNLNGKMNRDSFTFTELAELLDGIGFNVKIVPNENPAAAPKETHETAHEDANAPGLIEDVRRAVRAEIAASMQAMIDALNVR